MDGFINIGFLPSFHYDFLPHRHNHWEIAYYTEGSGTNYIGDKAIPFREGCIICQPPGIEHREQSENGFKNIHLSVCHMEDFGMDIPVFFDSCNNEYRQLLLQILNCYHIRNNNWDNILHAILAVLTEYMCSWNAERRKSRFVESCEKSIVENLSNCDFSLSERIDGIPLSRTYFMKLFKKETGLTPYDYLISKRIDYARSLLTKKHSLNWRVKDISHMCGFHDPYYFSRVFKKKTGVSPVRLRDGTAMTEQSFLQG